MKIKKKKMGEGGQSRDDLQLTKFDQLQPSQLILYQKKKLNQSCYLCREEQEGQELELELEQVGLAANLEEKA